MGHSPRGEFISGAPQMLDDHLVTAVRSEWADLMGVFEIAKQLKVTRQRVHQLAAEPHFPRPVAVLHAGSIWSTNDINEWTSAMRPESTGTPNVPDREPDRPQDDPYDTNAPLPYPSSEAERRWGGPSQTAGLHP